MKRSLSFLLALLLCLSVIAMPGGDLSAPTAFRANAANLLSAQITVQYQQTEARKILGMINAFRMGSDAWAWNESNTQKVPYSGLTALTYDFALEQTAMQRVAEIALSFSHTRPNGEDCFTAYTGNYSSRGENIAVGQISAEAVHADWREDDKFFDGQGHRRNMLGANFTAVGIACAVVNGTYYWVEEFGNPVQNPTASNPIDTETTVTLEIDSTKLTVSECKAQPDSLTMKVGDSAELPKLAINAAMPDTWTQRGMPALTVDTSWTSSDWAVAAVEGEKVVAKAAGTTTLQATILGKMANVNVYVISTEPTTQPTTTPTTLPTTEPSTAPTTLPTTEPTTAPTTFPTTEPTTAPTTLPTTEPTTAPTTFPTTEPTTAPTTLPTTQPTTVPTTQPTTAPTTAPTTQPTTQPTTVHSHSYSISVKPATLDKDGKRVEVCTGCGAKRSTKISKIQTIQLSRTKYIQDGRVKTPAVKVIDTKGSKLKNGRDFKLTFSKGRKEVGTYRVKISFFGNYTGSKKLAFKIVPAKVTGLSATTGKNRVNLTWKAVPGATSYAVYYATDKSGPYQKIGSTKKTGVTVTKLKTGSVYYMRVRAVAKTGDKVYKGELSGVKKFKCK